MCRYHPNSETRKAARISNLLQGNKPPTTTTTTTADTRRKDNTQSLVPVLDSDVVQSSNKLNSAELLKEELLHCSIR